MAVVEVVSCNTAEDFLSAISIHGPIRKVPGFSDLVLFRGVSCGSGDGEHRLIPSSLRPENSADLILLSGYSVPSTIDLSKEWTQGSYEIRILGSFFRYADRNGLIVPEFDTVTRRMLQSNMSPEALFNHAISTGGYWPPDNLLSLNALAQHYGLPTRLLDWTRDALTAAYFAANGACRRIRCGENISDNTKTLAVWIFNADLLERVQHTALKGTNRPPDIPVHFVTAPAATNPNLHAQQGVFTVWRPKIVLAMQQLVERRPLDELIEERLVKDDIYIGSLAMFHKVTLPLAKAPELRHLLLRDGITAAKLFPGYQGAAESVREWATRQTNTQPHRRLDVSTSAELNNFTALMLDACTQYVTVFNPGHEHNDPDKALLDIKEKISLFASSLSVKWRD